MKTNRTARRRKDTRSPSVIMHKIADIRGGVSVNTKELGGDYLREGAFLSAPINGICHVVKTAVVVAETQGSEVEVKVGKLHNFKVGDFVMKAVKDKAVKITAIDTTNEKSDTLTLSETLGAMKQGAALLEAAKAAATDTSELKYLPIAINGTGQDVEQGRNLVTDAQIHAVTHGNPIPEVLAPYLTCIVDY